MMLPGVELARKRRVHQSCARGPPPELSSSASSSSQRAPSSLGSPLSTAMDASALAARLRLEEKLRSVVGSQRSSLSLSSSFSSCSLGSSRGAGSAGSRRSTPEIRTGIGRGGGGDSIRGTRSSRVLQRTGSRIDVCAVCLDGFGAEQRVTWLPCCHKYHTDCVMPWIAAHSHCPCCRTHVPSPPPPPPPLLL